MAHVLAITNRKGGSGKTSTAVNLAAELASRGRRVLLIDLDTQGHCALGLGVKVARGAPTVHGFLAARNSLAEAIVPTVCPGLDLAPADTSFQHGWGQQGEQVLQQALHAGKPQQTLASRYELILIDTPPSLDALLINAMCAADRLLVPFVPHPLAADGVRQLSRVVFRLASQGANDRLKLMGLLPVMLDLRLGLHRQVLDDLARQLGAARCLAGIRSDIRVAEAFAAGVPVQLHAPRGRAAADYAALADFIITQWPATLPAPATPAKGGDKDLPPIIKAPYAPATAHPTS